VSGTGLNVSELLSGLAGTSTPNPKTRAENRHGNVNRDSDGSDHNTQHGGDGE